MTPVYMDESVVEEAALAILQAVGYRVAFGPDIAPGESAAERARFDEVVLVGRLRAVLARLNPTVPADGIADAVRKVLALDAPTLLAANRLFHDYLVNGVGVEVAQADGSVSGETVWLVDFAHPERNDWLAVNQFTVIENGENRRADIVLFVNGLPFAVIELKNPADADTDILKAFKQFLTYKTAIPSLFRYNGVLVISDGLQARAGTLTADWERFAPWRTVDGETLAPATTPQQEVLLHGMFAPARVLTLLRDYTVFEDDGATVQKKMAAYHQYHAAEKAIACTLDAAAPHGDRRIGVVWHTQGSGKSLTMAFFAGKIIRHPAMENPTLVVITDRNDLDDQLFGTFCGCQALLRQTPVQADSRAHLRDLLNVASGSVIFTTIQKFMPDEKGDTFPLLSPRRNIVVIADEAHRSQYGFGGHVDTATAAMAYGFAKHLRDALPGASFIGFTGTPVEKSDRSTRAVFGDEIDIYDIQRAVEDGAIVPIYYEARLAKLALDDAERPHVDPRFEEVTESEEMSARERLRTKWASLEAMVGAEKRIHLIAEDLVRHFEERCDAIDGKAMIVCMSRRICVELYHAIIALRPQWHGSDDATGTLKVVMTGSASDPAEWQPHIRNKARREKLAIRFKDPTDGFQIVIVRDMWLTGFDAPSLHTMYLDKPMQGHNLMQAIARVNRVFRDKPGGLVVDYLGLADQLKHALADYTTSGGDGTPTIDLEQLRAVLQEKYEIVAAMFHGFEYRAFFTSPPPARLGILMAATDFILQYDPDTKRYLQAIAELSKVFALASSLEEAQAIRDEVAFFQAVRAALVKATEGGERKAQEDIDQAIRQIVARAVATDGVVDIFQAAGLPHPDISILSDEFLEDVRRLPHRNLAVELLRKLLNNQIRACFGRNVVQGRSFLALLEQAMRKYQNRAIEAAQVIEELIALAKELQSAAHRGDELGLTDDEIAFYDALAQNESARQVMQDDILRMLARELVQRVRQNISIDWSVRESARAKLRVIVKNLLRKYGYPPDLAKAATDLVLEQTEALCKAWGMG